MERSRTSRRTRRGIAVCAAMIALLTLARAGGAQTFTSSAVLQRDGNPTLVVDGRPFFFYGAAFFYERIPAERWRASMLALRTLGFNTLDLYVPWNWHELADGEFDFDGRTNARRNLRAVLALARELQFKLIVRPGPVVRNEWRNGGYPAWLLSRPEYGMPLHDVLEGRYPATATLQNANSDDAAAEWMNNATHMRYAGRWLRTALREFVPYADLVVALALDDDQGAYIDNQTWPAPHLQAYLRRLESIMRDIVGPQLPVFINTYEMKVTASAPVWAMGNWYQSDAYSIGEHDRAALEFSTGLLQTQTRYPVAMSEFQAGWLAPPEDPTPRPADPTNTTLALHTLLGLGMRGVIDFPAQDTLNPAGWEAPFANAAYAWDAALGADLLPGTRYAATANFGALVQAYGTELAAARRLADGAIAYLTSAYDATRLTNADVFGIVARTQTAQQQCRALRLTCDLVDLRFANAAMLQRYAFLVLPAAGKQPMIAAVRERLVHYHAHGGRIVATPPRYAVPHSGGIADATVLFAPDGAAFLDIVNYDVGARSIPATRIMLPGGRQWQVAPLTVNARDAVLLRTDSTGTATAATTPTAQPRTAATACEQDCPPPRSAEHEHAGPHASQPQLRIDDSAGDGYPRLHFTNDFISLTIAPDAGARAFSFLDEHAVCAAAKQPEHASKRELFTSVGALRDDVAVQPPLSTSDRIGKYTRSFPAGMFNRSFSVLQQQTADSIAATFSYDAPDVVPNGARFRRTVMMRAGEPGFTVKERVTFGSGAGADAQRSVRYDSIDSRKAAIIDERAQGALGFLFRGERDGCVAIIAWPAPDVEDVRLMPEQTSMVVRMQFAPDRETTTRYSIYPVHGIDGARSMMLKERAAVAAKR